MTAGEERWTEERWIIDRFEGQLVVVERGEAPFELPRTLLPRGCREGDVLRVRVCVGPSGERFEIERDEAATAERGERLTALSHELRKDDPGGDIKL